MAGLFQKPEDVIGMKPEELKAKLDAGASKDDLKALSDAQEKLGGTLKEIQDALKTLTTKPPEPITESDPEDPTAAVLTDPAAFINRTTAPLRNATIANQAAVAELRARQEHGRFFEKHGADFLKWMDDNKISLDQRGRPGFFDYAMKTFIGDNVMSGKFQAESYPSLLGTSSISPNPNDPADPNQGLDPEMAQFYKQRKIPLDRAKKLMDLMDKGEHIDMEHVKVANA
jgi:hypothetical protein